MKNKLSINIGVIDSSVKTCVMKSLVAFSRFLPQNSQVWEFIYNFANGRNNENSD